MMKLISIMMDPLEKLNSNNLSLGEAWEHGAP
jgi:hypothetical protein